METVNVALKKESDDSYQIVIGYDLLQDIASFLKERNLANSYAIIADSNTKRLYGEKILKNLQGKNLQVHLISFPAGEKNKTRKTKEKIEDKMLSLGLGRDCCMIALGGGVVGDLAGFVAATYMRGIPYIQVPTSLLAMVDSSIGGKTGLDVDNAKNAIGAFHQPQKVFIDLNFLKTLPKKEFANGLAEIVKHALIADKDFFGFLEKNADKILKLDEKVLVQIIKRSCKIKASVVMQDEKEKGLRKLLNYGHTIGHAIESSLSYKIGHGQAVSIGMSYSAKLSARLGFLDEGSVIRQNNLLSKVGLLEKKRLDIKKIIKNISYDKKIINGKINFILLKSIGNAFVNDKVSIGDIKTILKE